MFRLEVERKNVLVRELKGCYTPSFAAYVGLHQHANCHWQLESELAPVKGFGIASGELRAPRIAKYRFDVTFAQQSGKLARYRKQQAQCRRYSERSTRIIHTLFKLN